jgi:hypothetical protein
LFDIRYFLCFSVSYYTVFPIHSIMQNEANFRNDKMNINLDMTSKYMILSALRGQKTNPIRTQLKPKRTQTNPILNLLPVLL